ncbi:MAG TPA: hypothetical protein VES62_11070, partial [Thermoleophilaceae bacterium]|nr:hypothetical protein [Thermoleophilaceae bacterium]
MRTARSASASRRRSSGEHAADLGHAEAAGEERLGDVRYLAGIVAGHIGEPVEGLDAVEEGQRAPELMAHQIGVAEDGHDPSLARHGQVADPELQHLAQRLEDRHAVGERLERTAHHGAYRGAGLQPGGQHPFAQVAMGDDAGG